MTEGDAKDVRFYYRQYKRLQKAYALTGEKKYHVEAMAYAALLLDKLTSLPEWQILKPDDFAQTNFFCEDIIPKLIVNTGIPFSCYGRSFDQFKQYCGFGENWKKHNKYSRRAKFAVASYLITCALPVRMPVRNKWGKELRRNFFKFFKKFNEDPRKRQHALRLAIINTARKLLKEIYKLQKAGDGI